MIFPLTETATYRVDFPARHVWPGCDRFHRDGFSTPQKRLGGSLSEMAEKTDGSPE